MLILSRLSYLSFRSQLKLVKCSNLMVCDINTSDPYAVVSIGSKPVKGVINSEEGVQDWLEQARTEIKYENLNPDFNEQFDILVYDKNNDLLRVGLWDYDFAKSDDKMGYFLLDLRNVPLLENVEINDGVLVDGHGGTIHLSYYYLPLVKSNDIKKTENEEEAFLMNVPKFSSSVDKLRRTTSSLFSEMDSFNMVLTLKQLFSFI